MKLSLIEDTFSFDYKSPIVVGKKELAHNTGLAVTISDSLGNKSLIHLTALPHFHSYSINEWQSILGDFFLRERFHFNDLDFTLPYFNTTNAHVLKGELLFIVESVLFAFIEKKYPESLSFIRKADVKINGLYSEEFPFEDVPGCVKIKIRPTEESKLKTAKVMKELLAKNPAVRFRLDGNRTFELNEVLSFIEFLQKFQLEKAIEYIEEPFKNFSDVYSFQSFSSIPLALDESVTQFAESLGRFPDFFFVIKPSLIGLSGSFQLMNKYSNRVIISSSYEFPTAMRPLFYLASLNSLQYHGLDTIKFLPKKYGIKLKQSFLLSF